MTKPLVSVIVPTKNSAATLARCLESVRSQTYKNIELIVVDNHSKDKTRSVAKRYADKVYTYGPERSAQRNFGVEKASGKYVAIIDSDMELDAEVIATCVEATVKDVVGVIIPEESFGEGFWARCKKLERSFYVGVDWMEAARFFSRLMYLSVGGYDTNLVSGEDWDLSQRIGLKGRLIHISPYIHHNEGKLRLTRTLSKKYYYAKHFALYTNKTKQMNQSNLKRQTGPMQRYLLYFRQPARLLHNPLLGMGMLFMKTAEFGWGFLGYVVGKINTVR